MKAVILIWLLFLLIGKTVVSGSDWRYLASQRHVFLNQYRHKVLQPTKCKEKVGIFWLELIKDQAIAV